MGPGNDQLATVSYEMKHLTPLMLRPIIALNAVKFYSACVVIQYKHIFCQNYNLIRQSNILNGVKIQYFAF